jgi:hypothetical protein
MIPWTVLITGAVGVGGTALGAWLNSRMQTKNLRLSLDAENERARLTEKRRIYAACLTAFTELNLAIFDHDKYRRDGGEEKALYRLAQQRDDSISALSVAKLIAPTEVNKLLNSVLSKYMERIWQMDEGQSLYVLRGIVSEIRVLEESLDNAIRADLGETE